MDRAPRRRWLRRTGAAGLVLLLLLAVLGLWGLRPPAIDVPEAGPLVLSDVTLVEPDGPRRPGVTLRLEGGRIESVTSGVADPIETADAEAPVVAGWYALPGLVDLHVHMPPALAVGERALFGLLFLAHGVTTVRDTGSVGGGSLAIGPAVEDGAYAGPRVLACGPFLDGDPPDWPGARVVRDPADAAIAITELREAGARCAKLYNGLRPPEVEALIEAAAEHGIHLVGHVPESVRLTTLRGVEVQHLMGVTHRWARLRDADVTRYVETTRRASLRHTPTLVAFHQYARIREGGPTLEDERHDWLPRYYRELVWDPERNVGLQALEPEDGSPPRARADGMRRVTAALHEAGVWLGVGTDTPNPGLVPGVSLHQEMAWLVEAGLPLETVWRAATIAGAEVLGVPGLGTLEPGAPADLLLFRSDPTRDLAALDSLEAVVAAGRLYWRNDLEAALARARDHFRNPVYDGLSRGAASLALGWIAATE